MAVFAALIAFIALCSDPKLFQVADRPPQFPSKCRLPSDAPSVSEARRLGGTISRVEAEKACEDWTGEEKEGCIYDLVATGDLELASAGAY